MDKTDFMRAALELAKEAASQGEVPVGAVIVRNGEIVSGGRNRRESNKNALCHAEIEAIDNACRKLGGWRLWECEMFVTLEPCPMCAGALGWAQLQRIVYGAGDNKRGYTHFSTKVLHPKTQVGFGVLADECGELMKRFFEKKR